eukprot:2839543-Pleurochrysis_carterae.AAC.2
MLLPNMLSGMGTGTLKGGAATDTASVRRWATNRPVAARRRARALLRRDGELKCHTSLLPFPLPPFLRFLPALSLSLSHSLILSLSRFLSLSLLLACSLALSLSLCLIVFLPLFLTASSHFLAPFFSHTLPPFP